MSAHDGLPLVRCIGGTRLVCPVFPLYANALTQYPNGGFPVIPQPIPQEPLGPRDDRGNLAGEPGLLGVEGHQATALVKE